MTSPLGRALRLLDLLQSAPLRTVPELSERLGVDERTVRRSMQQLRDIDIPVESVRGRYGGYRISPGYRLPPLLLSNEEAVAVVAALIRAGADSDTAAQTALSKLRRVLPAASARRVEALIATTEFAEGAGSPLPGMPDADVLLTVADAIADRRPLELRYRNRDDVPSRRTVHPYGLVARAGRWYLIALDVDHAAGTGPDAGPGAGPGPGAGSGPAEERTFRVDRIRTARPLPGRFTEPAPERTAADLVDRFARADYPWHVVLRIRSSPERIRARLPASVATLTPLDTPGWQRADIHAQSLDWLPPVIAALDGDVVIDHPDELRSLVTGMATRLRAIGRQQARDPVALPQRPTESAAGNPHMTAKHIDLTRRSTR